MIQFQVDTLTESAVPVNGENLLYELAGTVDDESLLYELAGTVDGESSLFLTDSRQNRQMENNGKLQKLQPQWFNYPRVQVCLHFVTLIQPLILLNGLMFSSAVRDLTGLERVGERDSEIGMLLRRELYSRRRALVKGEKQIQLLIRKLIMSSLQ
ncbi:uncharacterized protein LOC131145772 [Malania oleifera]|uniref:uncharacterized protein LOC131145772 n=1 Tax=Malania oleifera TaxID=397392 RepID=UPI0025AEB19D|nr:uncharacterized protein LOC131145772 [Malania oleifera]